MVKLSEYLRESMGLPFRQLDLKALDFLCGKTIGNLHFDAGLDIPYQAPYAYTTPFFYPIGYTYGADIGFHLHPEYLGWENLVVAHSDHGKVLMDLCRQHCSFDHAIAHRLLVQLLSGDNIAGRWAGQWVQDRNVADLSEDTETYEAWEQVLLSLAPRT